MGVRTFAAAQILKVLPRAHITRAVGRLCDTRLSAQTSRLVSNTFCRMYPVDLDEAEPQAGAYPSFDAFFTRRLRSGMRPIAKASVVSPADGRLSAKGRVEDGSKILVKGRSYDVGELIGDANEGERFRKGTFAVVYLAPADYHRVHSPVSGQLSLVRGIPGDYFPVNSIGEQYVPRLFVRNNRVALTLATESHGHVIVILVGAYIVGRISVSALPNPAVPPGAHILSPSVSVDSGDELGAFHLGSTAVVLFEHSADIRRALGRVRYGESLLSENGT